MKSISVNWLKRERTQERLDHHYLISPQCDGHIFARGVNQVQGPLGDFSAVPSGDSAHVISTLTHSNDICKQRWACSFHHSGPTQDTSSVGGQSQMQGMVRSLYTAPLCYMQSLQELLINRRQRQIRGSNDATRRELTTLRRRQVCCEHTHANACTRTHPHDRNVITAWRTTRTALQITS